MIFLAVIIIPVLAYVSYPDIDTIEVKDGKHYIVNIQDGVGSDMK